jgi:hypothetical protein
VTINPILGSAVEPEVPRRREARAAALGAGVRWIAIGRHVHRFPKLHEWEAGTAEPTFKQLKQ